MAPWPGYWQKQETLPSATASPNSPEAPGLARGQVACCGGGPPRAQLWRKHQLTVCARAGGGGEGHTLKREPPLTGKRTGPLPLHRPTHRRHHDFRWNVVWGGPYVLVAGGGPHGGRWDVVGGGRHVPSSGGSII